MSSPPSIPTLNIDNSNSLQLASTSSANNRNNVFQNNLLLDNDNQIMYYQFSSEALLNQNDSLGSIANPQASVSSQSNKDNNSDEPNSKKTKFGHQYFKNQSFSDTPTSNSKENLFIAHKKLEERIGGILCCTVCLDLPHTAIYQCINGHLMCAGCFSHLLADARLKDEQATCPNCRCEISKTSCCRNLAVEKTLNELPTTCNYCNSMFARSYLEIHQRNDCPERPTLCLYERIGCKWAGPFHELEFHAQSCFFPNKNGQEILNYLKIRDSKEEEEKHSIFQLVNLLSFEKICFNDLQFKQYKTDEITPKLYFETNRFSAFFHQWVLKARINDNQKNPNLTIDRFLSYQLILKSKLSTNQASLDLRFCVLKGPFGEVAIEPSVQSFEFNQNKLETDFMKFNIKSTDCNKLLASKTINFRFFMFQP